MAGRHRMLLAVARAKGADRNHPKRYRLEEPETAPLGDPPRHLQPKVRACWREIVDMAPRGCLTGSDRIALELAASLLQELRDDPRKFTAIRFARLTSLLLLLGVTRARRMPLGHYAPERRNRGG